MNLTPPTIKALVEGRAMCLQLAESARSDQEDAAAQANEYATKRRELLGQAEDFREILYRADPDNTEYHEPTPSVGASSTEAISELHAFAGLLSAVGLPAEFDAGRCPRVEVRLKVATVGQAEEIIKAVEATGGTWHSSRPTKTSYTWIETRRYGSALDVDLTIDYEPAPPEASEALPEAAEVPAEAEA